MPILPGRLGTLAARDLMTHDLVVLKDTDPLTEAISSLKEKRITGAPVVDESGTFIGILSISDLLEHRSQEGSMLGKREPIHHEKSSLPQANEEKVWDRMSDQVTSVTTDTPIVEVARVMCEGHWHRVPVVDENSVLVGIVSTMDVLAALVHTADEL